MKILVVFWSFVSELRKPDAMEAVSELLTEPSPDWASERAWSPAPAPGEAVSWRAADPGRAPEEQEAPPGEAPPPPRELAVVAGPRAPPPRGRGLQPAPTLPSRELALGTRSSPPPGPDSALPAFRHRLHRVRLHQL